MQNILLHEKNPLNNIKITRPLDQIIENNISEKMFIQLLQWCFIAFTSLTFVLLIYIWLVKFSWQLFVLSVLSGGLWFISYKWIMWLYFKEE